MSPNAIDNGNASADTVRTYPQQFKLFVSWCDRKRLKITQLTEEHIKEYPGYLGDKSLKVATIGLKLSVIRIIFEIAVIRAIIPTNPALRVKPPTERRDPPAAFNYFFYITNYNDRDLTGELLTNSKLRSNWDWWRIEPWDYRLTLN